MRITNSKGMEIIAGVSSVDTPHDTDCPVWFVNPDGTARQQFIVEVDFNGEIKSLALNSTNRNCLIQHFGKETDAWVNQSCKIELIKMNVAGSLKDVIYLDPICI